MTLDITNIVEVSIVDVPSGLSEVNVNNVLLLTNETPDNIDQFRTYINARDVGTDYGTDSQTYALANTVFSQSPNIRTGNGSLTIAPLVGSVSATSGDFVTASISANLAAIIAVNNGDLKVVLNGSNISLTALNFVGCTTLANVATILQRKLPDVIVTASSTALTFTSKKVGTESTVVVEVLSGGSGTNLAASGFFNTAAGSSNDGDDSSGETIAAALIRLGTSFSYTPFFTNLQIEDDVALATAAAVQPLYKIWIHSWSSSTDLAGIINSIGAAGYTRTKCLLYTTSISLATTFRAAYVSRSCSVNFDGVNTFASTYLKTLVGLPTDTGITQTIFNSSKAVGADTYDDFGIPGVSVTKFGTTGLFFDQVYGQLWLQFELTIAIFNSIATGIRQTPEGQASEVAAINSIMSQGVTTGYIGVGLQWNSSEIFGNANNLRSSVFAAGYYIFPNSIVTQPEPDRAARIAPLVQIAYKEAGFIFTATVIGLVEA